VVVGRIVRGGVAERSGLLHEGDEILEVNGIEVRGKSINDVCDLVASMTGTITFLIVPAASSSPSNTTVVKPALTPNQPNVVSCLDSDEHSDLVLSTLDHLRTNCVGMCCPNELPQQENRIGE
jgi:PDZ domain